MYDPYMITSKIRQILQSFCYNFLLIKFFKFSPLPWFVPSQLSLRAWLTSSQPKVCFIAQYLAISASNYPASTGQKLPKNATKECKWSILTRPWPGIVSIPPRLVKNVMLSREITHFLFQYKTMNFQIDLVYSWETLELQMVQYTEAFNAYQSRGTSGHHRTVDGSQNRSQITMVQSQHSLF